MNTFAASDQVRRDGWFTANQQALMAELGRVRAALTAGLPESTPESHPPAPAQESWPVGTPPSALDRIVTTFGLSPFERDLLLFCAGPDLDAKFATLLAQIQGDPRRTAPTFGLALAALPGAHWSALSPVAPLRRWRLLELGPGDSLTASALRIDEWTLNFLTGVPHLDERLQPLLRLAPPAAGATPSQCEIARQLYRLCHAQTELDRPPVLQLCSESADDALMVASLTAAQLGCRLFRMSAADVPTGLAERDTFVRLWEREAALGGCVLAIDFHKVDHADARRPALSFVESTLGLSLVLSREPFRSLARTSFKLDVPRSSIREQHQLWHETLGTLASALNGQLEAVVGQFSLNPRQMREVAAILRAGNGGEAPADIGKHPLPQSALWSLCRVQSRARLESLAQHIEPVATWDDLVLPELQLRTLHEIATHVRQRFRVYEQWGFASKGSRGLGVSALFSGASGTGKTMAAEVLAHELGLDLFRIDLSAVVSKYIGETEKNLRAVFDAAEAGGVILLFDEADALFGKRSEVKDSHDRYANIEVSYLLQRMEAYRGLAILTTNFRQALDSAFLRRLRFVVPFPFPDAAQRAQIWRRIFPSATPTDRVDHAKLARLNVAGGSIRNIALNAAFLAADAGEPVQMSHLLQAARSECGKLERPPSEAELGGWT